MLFMVTVAVGRISLIVELQLRVIAGQHPLAAGPQRIAALDQLPLQLYSGLRRCIGIVEAAHLLVQRSRPSLRIAGLPVVGGLEPRIGTHMRWGIT